MLTPLNKYKDEALLGNEVDYLSDNRVFDFKPVSQNEALKISHDIARLPKLGNSAKHFTYLINLSQDKKKIPASGKKSAIARLLKRPQGHPWELLTYSLSALSEQVS